MAIGRKQIGWSQESNLLWEISRQMEKLTGVAYNSGGGGGGGVTKITAGDGITISPSGGTGNVTINSVGGLVTKTKSEIDSLISSDGLIPGQFYLIEGVNTALYGGTDIIIQAATENTLVPTASGFFYNPNYGDYPIWSDLISYNNDTPPYNFFQFNEAVTANTGATGLFLSYGLLMYDSGDWSGATTMTGIFSGATANISGAVSPSYNIGDIVIWGGRVWENINGNIGTSDNDFELDPAEWDLVAYNTNDYTLVVDEIKYDYDNDVIYYRRDGAVVESNIVDIPGVYTTIKSFQWGNSNVRGNRISNSGCNIINFRGNSFKYNEVIQDSGVGDFISDTTSSIDYNVITDSYLGNCVLSNSSNISTNILIASSLYDVKLSHDSSISNNNISYSAIYTNFIEGVSSINENELTQYSEIQNNSFLTEVEIDKNVLSNSSKIYNNAVLNNALLRYNRLENFSLIYNNYQDGQGSAQNTIESNTLSSNSSIYNLGPSKVNRNNLYNYASISSCGVSGGSSLLIADNNLNNSSFINILETNGDSILYNNTLSNSSTFNTINLNYNEISNNTFVISGFTNCTMDQNSSFIKNDFYNSGLSYLNDWGDEYAIQFCRLNNSSINGGGIGSLYGGNIVNTTMTDVTLTQDLGGASYIFEQYSKTISLCPVGSGYQPRISFINGNTGTLIVDDYNA
jgi:hypothetical protein